MTRIPLLAFAALFAAIHCQAEPLKAAAVFTDKAILQRGCEVPVWGWASPNESVAVEFAGQKAQAKTGAGGEWSVKLKPLDASFEGRQLKISSGSSQIVLNDVVVGDVWLCSGQSNMQFNLASAEGGKEAAAESKGLSLRFIEIPNELSKEPLSDLKARVSWVEAAPDNAWRVSAVGFFFAREMRRKLDAPQGLIVSAWPGSQVVTWIPKEALPASLYDHAKDAEEEEYAKLWANPDRKAAEAAVLERMASSNNELFKIWAKEKLHWRSLHLFPGWTFNAKILPLAPYAIKGVLWYQGEDNHAMGMKYSEYLQLLAASWRKEWKNPSLPFFIALLAPFKYEREGQLPAFWTAQADAAKRMGHAAIVSTIDIGNANDIHPKKKEPLGERFALAAMKECFKASNSSPGPLFKSCSSSGAKALVRFENAAGGLKADGETLSGFELAGADKAFVPAEAVLEGKDSVALSAPSVAKPVYVRYAWSNTPNANLKNSEGLPAMPFSSESAQSEKK